jgi:hypothetical protein
MVILASVLLASCASQSVDCSMGAGHNGCTSGTKEYEQMVQQQDAAEIDDAMCRSYGAEPGSPAYAECRRKKTGDRQMFQAPRASQTKAPSNSN